MSYKYMFNTDERIKVVEFYLTNGLTQTIKAITLQGKNISKRTIYRWLKLYQKSKDEHLGQVVYSSMCPKSKRPHKLPQKKVWNDLILIELQKLRIHHPGLGKEKCHIILQRFATTNNILKIPSICTIGRIISHFKKGRSIPNRKGVMFRGDTGKLYPIERIKQVKIRRKDYNPSNPGDLAQLDTIIIQKRGSGSKRFIRTGIDIATRITDAFAFTTHHATNTNLFVDHFQNSMNLIFKHIQTDNGTEFAGEFTTHTIKGYDIIHFHNYPKSPKQNAHIERFNRSVQEEFVNHYLDLLFNNLKEFNKKLQEYINWYNSQRPHWSLQFKTPMQVFLEYQG